MGHAGLESDTLMVDYLRPWSDVSSKGNWTNTLQKALIADVVDDEVLNDSDYVELSKAQVGDYFDLRLDKPGGLILDGSNVVLRIRAINPGTKDCRIRARVYAGTLVLENTLLDTGPIELTGSWATYIDQDTWTSIKSKIVDFLDLFVRVEVVQLSGEGEGSDVAVSFIEVEMPDIIRSRMPTKRKQPPMGSLATVYTNTGARYRKVLFNSEWIDRDGNFIESADPEVWVEFYEYFKAGTPQVVSVLKA
jgi:hypothetical protein